MKPDDHSTRRGFGDLASQASASMLRGANSALQLLVSRTAARLDLPESHVKVAFGRNIGHWGWCAIATIDGVDHIGPTEDDPLRALGSLVDKIEGTRK